MANRGSIRERHTCLIPYESADEINGFNVSKDTKRVTHQDFNGPRQLKIVIPLERQPAEVSIETSKSALCNVSNKTNG
jgi:hypothetical protein